MVVIVWWLDLQIPVQSVLITTKVVSLNPAHGESYLTQLYVIKFVSDLQQLCDFFWDSSLLHQKNSDRHNITEILLKVALNTII